MKVNFKNFFIASLFILFISCGDEPDVEYTVKIISSNANMSGWHFCDSDATVAFSKTLTDGSAIYEKTLCTNPDTFIKIYAITEDNANDLKAYIYKDGNKVAEYTSPTATGDKYYIDQTYNIVSDDDSSSDSSE